MIKLFLLTGLRLNEMINLKGNDINLMTGQLKVVEGKGSKDRILWIGEGMLDDLRRWREKQVNKLNVCDYVFTNRTKVQLVDRDVREMISNYSNKAGINKKVSPHTLRHSYATDLLRHTKNIRLGQKALWDMRI